MTLTPTQPVTTSHGPGTVIRVDDGKPCRWVRVRLDTGLAEDFKPCDVVEIKPRVVCWFSCGAASAVAAYLAVRKHGDSCEVVYCDTMATEHEDNPRFFRDIEKWIGKPITVIRSDKYATIDDVYEKTRYMAGIDGARCTVEMKKIPRFTFQRSDDIHIFGMTADEPKRIAKFEANNFELSLEWNLRDGGFTKDKCLRLLEAHGIALPVRYSQGFANNNCKACPKATSLEYWVRTRRYDPEAFARRAEQSRTLGVRLTRWKGERIFIDEIPPDADIPDRFLRGKESISCGPECGSPGRADVVEVRQRDAGRAKFWAMKRGKVTG